MIRPCINSDGMYGKNVYSHGCKMFIEGPTISVINIGLEFNPLEPKKQKSKSNISLKFNYTLK